MENPLSREDLVWGMSPCDIPSGSSASISVVLGECYLALRLDRARHLVRQTSLSVLEIALACGFTSASHFLAATARASVMRPRAIARNAR
ncbi:helix-turn-helix domain-containing protein [Bradyrhizobium sp. 172]|nr:helix-turn-helix domain-containing protein [Bradyrhizobium sp. 172]